MPGFFFTPTMGGGVGSAIGSWLGLDCRLIGACMRPRVRFVCRYAHGLYPAPWNGVEDGENVESEIFP